MSVRPEVSVVICTYNREKYIGNSLEAILNQDAPQELYEVVVIDNNCTDRSGQIIKDFIAAHPDRPYRYHFEASQGISYARNAGINLSKGRLIAYVDDDAIAEPNLVSRCIEFYKNHPNAAAVGGKVLAHFTEGKPKWFSKYVRKVVSIIDMGEHEKLMKGNLYPFGANMSFRASTFEKHGQFKINLGRKGKSLIAGEEKDMFDRLKVAGEEIWYDPISVVHHIIDPYRLTEDYIRRFARGVGWSERVRLKEKGPGARMMKWLEYRTKRAGSLVLGAMYNLKGEPEKAKMIMDVMRWIEEGYASEGEGL